jgi:hypothetical protein
MRVAISAAIAMGNILALTRCEQKPPNAENTRSPVMTMVKLITDL